MNIFPHLNPRSGKGARAKPGMFAPPPLLSANCFPRINPSSTLMAWIHVFHKRKHTHVVSREDFLRGTISANWYTEKRGASCVFITTAKKNRLPPKNICDFSVQQVAGAAKSLSLGNFAKQRPLKMIQGMGEGGEIYSTHSRVHYCDESGLF